VVAKAAWGDARDRSDLGCRAAPGGANGQGVWVPGSDETRDRTLRCRSTLVLIGNDVKASWRRGHREETETASPRGLAVIRASCVAGSGDQRLHDVTRDRPRASEQQCQSVLTILRRTKCCRREQTQEAGLEKPVVRCWICPRERLP
jgi:hypothetical protein